MTDLDDRRAARARYHHEHYQLRSRLAGRRPRTPAAPVADHIQACIGAGMTARSVALAAGITDSIVRDILDNPDRTVRARTRDRILSVRPEHQPTPASLARRIQALAALGWSCPVIAEIGNVNVDTIKAYRRGELPRVMREGPKVGILAAYDALHMRAPVPADNRERGMVARTRAFAARNGWAPPLAFDNIDDLNEHPHGSTTTDPDVIDDAAIERTLAGDRVPLTRPERVEVIRRLAQRGLSDAEMGAVVGISGRSVQRIRTEFGIDTGWVAA